MQSLSFREFSTSPTNSDITGFCGGAFKKDGDFRTLTTILAKQKERFVSLQSTFDITISTTITSTAKPPVTSTTPPIARLQLQYNLQRRLLA